jgi:hypothetical protein
MPTPIVKPASQPASQHAISTQPKSTFVTELAGLELVCIVYAC